MSISESFPPLVDWEPTRKTLHLYSRILGAISRAHAQPHPRWWHVSLTVQPTGLQSDPIELPTGGTLRLAMDLRAHEVVLSTSAGVEQRLDMTAGRSATEMGNHLLEAVKELGLAGEVECQRFVDGDSRSYEPAAAETFLTALSLAEGVLERHRENLVGEVSPVQVWPHGLDLSFEWYGTRVETSEEGGEIQELPSQINFGLYPAEPAYFYANPWPFDADDLIGYPLPAGARWHQEEWRGTILPYAEVVGDSNAEERLLAYLGEVFRVASPTLLV